jgi:serine/threonine protein kinase
MAQKQVGKYILSKQIGEGMYGKVYKGVDNDTGTTVAIKMIDSAKLNERLTT